VLRAAPLVSHHADLAQDLDTAASDAKPKEAEEGKERVAQRPPNEHAEEYTRCSACGELVEHAMWKHHTRPNGPCENRRKRKYTAMQLNSAGDGGSDSGGGGGGGDVAPFTRAAQPTAARATPRGEAKAASSSAGDSIDLTADGLTPDEGSEVGSVSDSALVGSAPTPSESQSLNYEPPSASSSATPKRAATSTPSSSPAKASRVSESIDVKHAARVAQQQLQQRRAQPAAAAAGAASPAPAGPRALASASAASATGAVAAIGAAAVPHALSPPPHRPVHSFAPSRCPHSAHLTCDVLYASSLLFVPDPCGSCRAAGAPRGGFLGHRHCGISGCLI
jgi:hypothetical protein